MVVVNATLNSIGFVVIYNQTNGQLGLMLGHASILETTTHHHHAGFASQDPIHQHDFSTWIKVPLKKGGSYSHLLCSPF